MPAGGGYSGDDTITKINRPDPVRGRPQPEPHRLHRSDVGCQSWLLVLGRRKERPMTKRPISVLTALLVIGFGPGFGCSRALTTNPSPEPAPPVAIAETETEAEVPRDELRNGGEAARFSEEVREGRPYGIRIDDVRPDGVYAKIGLQNGDVLTALNAVEITSPEQALQVFDSMTTVNRFTLVVERDGKKLERSFRVR
jgi:hypothetical protein